jgi:hypothetical protein
MKERISAVLRLIQKNTHEAVEQSQTDGGINPGINGFAEMGEGVFVLRTRWSDFGHQTRLDFESPGGELIWLRLTHTFGFLDFENRTNAGHVAQLFAQNATASAFLAIAVLEGTPYVTLNTHGSYFLRWSDEEIAASLSDQLQRLHWTLLLNLQSYVTELGVVQVSPPQTQGE